MEENKIKEAAEKYMKSDELRYFQDPCDLDVKDAFIAGAKWALNNQWHDLIKNPNDLPDFKIYDWVLVTFRDNKDGVPHIAEYRNGVWNTFESYNGYWSSVKEVLGDAIAWMPMPEFKIKEE